MPEVLELSQALRAARRALEGMKGVTLLGDWTWDALLRKWVLCCRLTRQQGGGEPVPVETEWYFLVDTTYPWGSIKCHPAKHAGLVQTFPHQHFNGSASNDTPWRDGDICLNNSVHALGRRDYDDEPYDIHQRLPWYVQRALDWLEAAAQGHLVQPGDPFELPHFPRLSVQSTTVAFYEGPDTLVKWQQCTEYCGTVDLFCMRAQPELLLVKRFRSTGGRILVETTWGRVPELAQKNPRRAIWLRVPNPPILEPWQVPMTWEELRVACQAQGSDVDDFLERSLPFIRDGNAHVALLGFPIPGQVGEPPRQMHWQALQLPIVSAGTKTARGFRTNESGYWRRDRTEVFRPSTEVNWLTSENWHPDEIEARGRLSSALRTKKVLLIGAGALGAMLGEQLVRAGVHRLTIVDGDRLEVGNLVRHPLGMLDLKEHKAIALALRLGLASPHALIEAITSPFPVLSAGEQILVQQCDLILDCTGQDEMLCHLEAFAWQQTKQFVSLSLGFGARRLFCFTAHGSRFPQATFRECLHPWLERELIENAGQRLPREGVGCWHPVFPARSDDVSMMASIAVKFLESTVANPPPQPILTVFEQQYEQGAFLGTHKVASEVPGDL